MRIRMRPRRGITIVESAVVYPTVLLLLIGLVVGAAGIMRFQEVASLARRAARYAATHGWQYAKDTGNTAPSATDIFNTVVAPNAVGFDKSQLSCTVSYGAGKNWDYQVRLVNGSNVYTLNTVSVTVSYPWVPEAFLGGITLSSTSVMPMSY